MPAPAASPDSAPPALTPAADKGEKGARNLLLDWARAIERQRFDQAYALLGEPDHAGWARVQFAQAFAGLHAITVAAPEGTMEGAAGSLYYAAPITVTATDAQGQPVRMAGEAVLRRVNDVDGATPAQLRWHFERLTLSPAR